MELYTIDAWGTNLTIRCKGERSINDFSTTINDVLNEYNNTFSLYLEESEISLLNLGLKNFSSATPLFKEILRIGNQLSHLSQDRFLLLKEGKYDFNSIAKGHAVDYLADHLAAHFSYLMINFGGDIAVRGSNSYDIAIENPNDTTNYFATVPLVNAGIATSGNNYRPGHLESKYESVSVYGPSTTICDALSTALARTDVEDINYLPEGYKCIILPYANANYYYSF